MVTLYLHELEIIHLHHVPSSLLLSNVTPVADPAAVPNSGWPSNPGALITTVGDEFPDDVGENEDDVLVTERASLNSDVRYHAQKVRDRKKYRGGLKYASQVL